MVISPIAQKLFIKPEQCMLIMNAHESYFNLNRELPKNKIEPGIVSMHYSFVLPLVKGNAELKSYVTEAFHQLCEDTLFWISYPKQSSKIKTDLNQDKG
jgi:hypothetical protein